MQMQHMCNQTEKPGEVLRIITYTGRAPPERGTIFQASGIWKSRDFISVEVYERVAKSVILVRKKAQKG